MRLVASEVIFAEFVVTRVLRTARISNAKNTVCDKYYFKNECECFITISKHEKTDESTSAFILFECLEIVMKHDARVFEMTSLKKQYKIMQCCIFSHFSLKCLCMCDLLYSVAIHGICDILFLIIQ